MVSCALCAGGAAGATTLQRRADAAAVLRLHSTFVHSGNDSRHLMSSNVHREYLVVLRLCYITGMKQLCNCCPSFVDGLQLHPATLDTSTP